MEDTNQDIYTDSPRLHQGLLHRPQTPQRAISHISTSTEATAKPHQIEPPAYTHAPYLDSPPLPYHDSSHMSSDTSCSHLQQQPPVFHIHTPTDSQVPTASHQPSYSDDDDDEDVPLAQLILYPRDTLQPRDTLYPRDAPPAYSTVVRQSYRETLHQHLPRYSRDLDADEEAALERIRADDVRFTVERVVAMAVVIGLLVLSGILVGLLFLKD